MNESMQPGVLQTRWMKIEYLIRKLEIGDIIEFYREIRRGVSYSHWAVYIGYIDDDHYAIHLSTEHNDFGDKNVEIRSKITMRGSSAHVRSDSVAKIANDSFCRINNSKDNTYKPFPPRMIVERALIRLGEKGYRLLSNNCEHFANEIRYGNKESGQATVVQSLGLGVFAGVVSVSAGVGVAAALAGFAVLSNASKIQRALPKLGSIFAPKETH